MRKFYNKFHPEVTATEREDGNYNIYEDGRTTYSVQTKDQVEYNPNWVSTPVVQNSKYYWERKEEVNKTPPCANHDKETHEQSFETLLDAFWGDYRAFLLEKDRKYGSRYLHPLAVFSDISPIDRLNARLDEKLGRLIAGNKDEDTFDDLLGLLIHRKIVKSV